MRAEELRPKRREGVTERVTVDQDGCHYLNILPTRVKNLQRTALQGDVRRCVGGARGAVHLTTTATRGGFTQGGDGERGRRHCIKPPFIFSSVGTLPTPDACRLEDYMYWKKRGEGGK